MPLKPMAVRCGAVAVGSEQYAGAAAVLIKRTTPLPWERLRALLRDRLRDGVRAAQ